MNDEETKKILASLTVAYPSLADDKAMPRVRLWSSMFADEPYELVNAAVKTYIASDTKGFPPAIGKIKQLCLSLLESKNISEAEAVSLILKATRNGIYGSEEEFAKLPSVCQRIVVSPDRLKDWAQLDSDEVNTVIASNLRRAYVAEKTREQEVKALPAAEYMRLKAAEYLRLKGE